MCPATKIVIIRQDMLPARESAVHLKSTTVKPANKIVTTVGVDKYNRLSMQWPPKQPTMAARRSASRPVVLNQAALPTRTNVAGIRSIAGMTIVKPAGKVVVDQQKTTVQWPPHRPTMAVRHAPIKSVHGRVAYIQASGNLDFACPSIAWPPRRNTCASTRKTAMCPATKIVIIRQDMLPARESAVHLKSTTVKPANKIVTTVGVDKYNRLSMQWPPKQPTMAARRSASRPVVLNQAALPTRTNVAGIRSIAGMTIVKPAGKVVVDQQKTTVQWPPHRPTMAVRHAPIESVHGRVACVKASRNLDIAVVPAVELPRG